MKTKILCHLSYVVYRLITMTYRIRYFHAGNLETAKKLHPAGSFVFGLWHENFFAAVAAHKGQNISPMISQSNDGELISFIASKLGFTPVRGSTSRGGEQARQELYQRIEKGLKAAFTADGPKGPRRKMKSGLIDLSRSGQMPILPLGVDADRKWILTKSWDHSLIPKPFARVAVVYGSPTVIPKNTHGAEFAAAKRSIAEKINLACTSASLQIKNW